MVYCCQISVQLGIVLILNSQFISKIVIEKKACLLFHFRLLYGALSIDDKRINKQTNGVCGWLVGRWLVGRWVGGWSGGCPIQTRIYFILIGRPS